MTRPVVEADDDDTDDTAVIEALTEAIARTGSVRCFPGGGFPCSLGSEVKAKRRKKPRRYRGEPAPIPAGRRNQKQGPK